MQDRQDAKYPKEIVKAQSLYLLSLAYAEHMYNKWNLKAQ